MNEPATNHPEYTVSEISFALKRTVEDAYGFVRVRGEVSGYRGPHASGHCYFKLKDEKAVLDSVIWRGVFQKLKFKPEEGLEIIASGKLTTYPGSSRYQIVIETLEPAGEGALMALLEERKRKLAAEGLFDDAAKLPLPYLPRLIGVVTSPTGAVIRDILHRLADRFPVQVLVWPVRVQGDTSASEVSNAIAGFNGLPDKGRLRRPDLLIVARGGGSLEDLWSFNEEAVIRAAAASSIPIISAVGHETDWTLLDLVADLRAPTPTGAAELAVPVRSELLEAVGGLARRHRAAIHRQRENLGSQLRAAARVLPRPSELLNYARQRRDETADRLAQRLITYIVTRRAQFDRQSLRMTSRSLTLATQAHIRRVGDLSHRMDQAGQTLLRTQRHHQSGLSDRLNGQLLARSTAAARERLNGLINRDRQALPARLTRHRQFLEGLAKLLVSYSYQDVLNRGFALVRDAEDAPVRRAGMLKKGVGVSIEFADARVAATVDGPRPDKTAKHTAKQPIRRPNKSKQGSLF